MVESSFTRGASDNPRWHEAINGPDRAGYWEAMKVESTTLTKLKAWKIIPITSEMNILDSTWAFECKRYPDGNIRKFKARFCCRGDQQVFGIAYFDTFAPVVAWTTVRILLILSVIGARLQKSGLYLCILTCSNHRRCLCSHSKRI